MTWTDLQSAVAKHRMLYGVVLSLLIAVLLTMVSMALYISSGASRLDLSRPGYEKARREISNETDKSEFNPNGPLDSEALSDFQRRFSKKRDELSKLGTFNSTALDDNQLQISPALPEQ